MTHDIAALTVFGILFAISIFGYLRSSAWGDRLDRNRQRDAVLRQDSPNYRY